MFKYRFFRRKEMRTPLDKESSYIHAQIDQRKFIKTEFEVKDAIIDGLFKDLAYNRDVTTTYDQRLNKVINKLVKEHHYRVHTRCRGYVKTEPPFGSIEDKTERVERTIHYFSMIANSESYNHEITTTVNSKVKVLNQIIDDIPSFFRKDSENFGKVPMLISDRATSIRGMINNKIMKKYHKDTRTFRPQTSRF